MTAFSSAAFYTSSFSIFGFDLGITTDFLFETFELEPLNGDIPWSDVWSDGSTNGATITRSASNFTQGSYTWRVQRATPTFVYPGIETLNQYDFSTINYLALDIYIATLPTSGSVGIYMYDGSGYYGVYTSTLGASTLYINMADAIADGIDITAARIQIYGEGTGGSSDFYVDNLRTDVPMPGLGGDVFCYRPVFRPRRR
jgi:hypothetical protein